MCVFVWMCIYILYIHCCLCWVDCFTASMKHKYTDCQMHSPVGIGEMSSSLPPFEIFSPKKEMENSLLRGGGQEGGRGGWLVVEVGEKRVWDREREREGEGEDVHIWSCSTALSLGGSTPHTDPFGFIGRRRRAGRRRLAGRVRGESCGDVNCIIWYMHSVDGFNFNSSSRGLLIWEAASRLSFTLSPWIRPSVKFTQQYSLKTGTCLREFALSLGFKCANSCTALSQEVGHFSQKFRGSQICCQAEHFPLKRQHSLHGQTVWPVFRLWTWQDLTQVDPAAGRAGLSVFQ